MATEKTEGNVLAVFNGPSNSVFPNKKIRLGVDSLYKRSYNVWYLEMLCIGSKPESGSGEKIQKGMFGADLNKLRVLRLDPSSVARACVTPTPLRCPSRRIPHIAQSISWTQCFTTSFKCSKWARFRIRASSVEWNERSPENTNARGETWINFYSLRKVRKAMLNL